MSSDNETEDPPIQVYETSVRVECSFSMEVHTQGWGPTCKWDQVQKQALNEVDHWQLMLKEGATEPKLVPGARVKVTHIITKLVKDKH